MAAPGGFLESRSAAACRQQPGKGPGAPSDPLKREACKCCSKLSGKGTRKSSSTVVWGCLGKEGTGSLADSERSAVVSRPRLTVLNCSERLLVAMVRRSMASVSCATECSLMQVALKPRPTTHSGGGCRLIPRRFWVQKQGVRVDYKENQSCKKSNGKSTGKAGQEWRQQGKSTMIGTRQSKRRVPDQAHDGKHPFYPHLELEREKRSMNHR